VPGAVRTTVYDFAGDRSFWFIPLRHQYDKDVIYDYGGNLTAPIGQSILCGYKGLSFLGTISGGSYVLLAGTPLNDDLSWVTPILLRARDALHSVKRGAYRKQGYNGDLPSILFFSATLLAPCGVLHWYWSRGRNSCIPYTPHRICRSRPIGACCG